MCVCARGHMQTLGCRLQVRGSAASWRGPAPQEGAGAKAIQAYRWRLPLGLRGRAEQPNVWRECSGWLSLLRKPHSGRPAHAPRILSRFGFVFFTSPSLGSGAGTSQRRRHHRRRRPQHLQRPHSPQPKSALEAEGQQPPARSPPPRQSLDQHGGDRWERAGACPEGRGREGRG